MHIIEFESITIEGMGSIVKEITYPLNIKGITSIQGENGAGKTSFLNAAVWAIYGKTLKKNSSIEPWPHVLDSSYKGTKVSIKFSKGKNTYEIIRCRNYNGKVHGTSGGNRLMLLQDNKIPKYRDKKDLQLRIVELLGYSFELFKSSIVFGQNVAKLMQEDGPTKKRILEELFDVSFLKEAEAKVKNELSLILSNLQELSYKSSAEQTILNELHAHLENQLKQKNSFTENKKEELKNLKIKISQHKSQYKTNIDRKRNLVDTEKNLLKKLASIEKELNNSATDNEFKLDFEIKGLMDTFERKTHEKEKLLKEHISTPVDCPECGSPLSKKKVQKIRDSIEEKIKEINAELKLLNEKIQKKKSKYKKYKKEAERFAKKLANKKELARNLEITKLEKSAVIERINFNQKRVLELKEDYRRKENQTFDETSITNLNKKIEDSKEIIQNTLSKENKYKKKRDLYTWALKDPLSNSGMKAFIFNTMLEKTNFILKRDYSEILNFNIKLYIDLFTMNKNLAISIHQKDVEVPYDDLSGGQKQLVDIALIFAINDVVMENKPINILWLDEIFESLSSNNTEKVVEIIRKKSINRAIHLITHNKEFASLGRNIIKVKLDKNKHTQIDIN